MSDRDPSRSILSRRDLLKYAGGLSFLALMPNARGFFAARDSDGLPIFHALPYIQPGDSSALIPGKETQIVAFQTDDKTADFVVEYGPTPALGKKAKIDRRARAASGMGNTDHPAVGAGYNYAATLSDLDLSRRYYYRLTANGKKILEGEFTTRKKRGEKTRFVSFGDNASGSAGERAIAYQAYEARPDFVLNLGDNVYSRGLNSQYVDHFFPVYNAETADIKVGGPLLRSVPFYTMLGNHDVNFRNPEGHASLANFDQYPDALGLYTNMHLPLNGPAEVTHPTPLWGTKENLKLFQDLAGERYPRMANYSFDYGDCHFLCLDSNVYVDPGDPVLQAWIKADLKATDARWKFVAFHHPPFNVGKQHYREQHMRVLCPIFEEYGVDFCLGGHEHVYQRSMPFRFTPTDITRVAPKQADRRVPGKFTCDTAFDGKTNTKPDGILYLTTGAGGAGLYDPDFDNNPAKWIHEDDNNVAHVKTFISSQHSCTIFDVTANELTMTQIGEKGDILDSIRVTRA